MWPSTHLDQIHLLCYINTFCILHDKLDYHLNSQLQVITVNISNAHIMMVMADRRTTLFYFIKAQISPSYPSHLFLSHYQVIAVLIEAGTNVGDLQPPNVLFPDVDSLGIYSDINCDNPGSLPSAYITSEFDANLFPSNGKFIVGGSNQPNDRPDITNGLLCYAKTYTFFIRVYPEADDVS